jgi:anaerobic ribonucleoside-triphosphate reductase activating protein
VIRVAHEIADTEAEGPGRRTAVWVQGCAIRCAGCCNPELFDAQGGTGVDPEALADRVVARGVEGVTVLGGEPFDQADGLAALCRAVQARGRSVLVFTGYTLETLQARSEPAVAAALAAIDTLVDGPFDRQRPERRRRWVGSENQRLWHFTGRYGDADFEGANTVELRWDGATLTVNGWPGPRLTRGAGRW